MDRNHRAIRLVNLCQKPFTESVDCTSVCADDQPPENLIAAGPASSVRGFRVEHFVRPPVHLDFHFSVPVNMACVVIGPAFGGRDCSATLIISGETGRRHEDRDSQLIQLGRGTVRGEQSVLFVKNKVFERRYRMTIDIKAFSDVLGSRLIQSDSRTVQEESMKDINNLKLLRLTVSYFSGPKPVALEFVEIWGTIGTLGRGSSIRCETSKNQVMAALARLENLERTKSAEFERASGPLPPPPLLTPEGVSGHCQFYKASTTNLTWKKEHSGAVGGEKTERGMTIPPHCFLLQSQFCHNHSGPSSNVQRPLFLGTESKQLEEDKTYEYSSSSAGNLGEFNFSSTGRQCSSSSFQSPRVSNSENDSKTNSGCIPERFLDEITCEIMLLPMLLPSGHFVDRSTLDKLHHTDSMYGRQPSDPFTGVVFTEGAEPQFSVDLKQQIDYFLSQRRHGPTQDLTFSGSLAQVGQTLGSAAEIARHLSSKYASGVGEKRKRGGSLSELEPSVKTVTQTGTSKEGLQEKPGFSQSSGEMQRSQMENSELECCNVSQQAGQVIREQEREHEERDDRKGEWVVRGTSQSHEQELASSLDRELRDLLGN